jgi:hypothetical protein
MNFLKARQGIVLACFVVAVLLALIPQDNSLSVSCTGGGTPTYSWTTWSTGTVTTIYVSPNNDVLVFFFAVFVFFAFFAGLLIGYGLGAGHGKSSKS